MQNENSNRFKNFWKKIGGYIRPFVGILVIAWAAWRVYLVFFVDNKFGPETWLRLAFSGLVIGGMYALVAIGYSLVYGILGMINFAHGEVMMVGSFAGYFLLQALKSVPAPGANNPPMSFSNAYPWISIILETSSRSCFNPRRSAEAFMVANWASTKHSTSAFRTAIAPAESSDMRHLPN